MDYSSPVHEYTSVVARTSVHISNCHNRLHVHVRVHVLTAAHACVSAHL